MANLGKARIKAKSKKGVVTVKMMAKHPQLSHQEAERAKKKADWITQIVATAGGNSTFTVAGLGKDIVVGGGPDFDDAFIYQIHTNMCTVAGLGTGGAAGNLAGYDGDDMKVGDPNNASEKYNQALDFRVFAEVRKSVARMGNDVVISYV